MRKANRLILSFGCVVVSLLPAYGQYYFYNDEYYDSPLLIEVGASAGAMNCLTDLGGKKGTGKRFIKDINWNQSRPSGGLYVMAVYRNTLGARLELSLGSVQADDAVLKNDRSAAYGRAMRHLSFRSGIAEMLLGVEFYPATLTANQANLLVSPFILTGLGLFRFSPQASYNGNWVNLQVLRTEGQGFREYENRKIYRLSQFNFPVGAGIKYESSPSVCLRLEIIYRKLWTDYLDDVSKTYIDPASFDRYFAPSIALLARQLSDRRLNRGSEPRTGDIRGNPHNNDAYFSFNLKLGFILGRQRRR